MGMKIIGKIDFEKYNTFFLEYYKETRGYYCRHYIRPSKATYDQIQDAKKGFVYTLEGAIIEFESDMSISKILMECALLGITIDFIDILVPAKEGSMFITDTKIFQVIDTHKEDVSLYFDSIEAPRYYCALNKRKTDILKFLIIDRFEQDPKIKFLNGEYDKKSVIAGFRKRETAYEMCKKMNHEE